MTACTCLRLATELWGYMQVLCSRITLWLWTRLSSCWRLCCSCWVDSSNELGYRLCGSSLEGTNSSGVEMTCGSRIAADSVLGAWGHAGKGKSPYCEIGLMPLMWIASQAELGGCLTGLAGWEPLRLSWAQPLWPFPFMQRGAGAAAGWRRSQGAKWDIMGAAGKGCACNAWAGKNSEKLMQLCAVNVVLSHILEWKA